MKAKAKNDVRVLMEDGRYSNFIKGNEYRCILRGSGGEQAVLIDEDKNGYATDINHFNEDFELILE